jgi:ATP-dependent DNA helicase DinG
MSRRNEAMISMEEIFGERGVLRAHHPQYEYRPGQIRMAEAVYRAIVEGGHLLVEAETGTGKTLAYLIPALAATERIVISTGTKNLQEQLLFKDIPFLENALGRKLRVASMKGRSNYVCLYRLKRAEWQPLLADPEEVRYFDEIRQWAFRSETGDRAELADLPETVSFWSSIDARSEICLGQRCPDYDACFITKMRERALKADIVIDNHHLFFADLALRENDYGAVIPDYAIVIFDEAHELEEVASEYFGAQVSTYRVAELLRDVQSLSLMDSVSAAELVRVSGRVQQRAESFWAHFLSDGKPDGRYPLEPEAFIRSTSADPEACAEGGAQETEGGQEGAFELTRAGERLLELMNALSLLEATLATVKDPPQEVDVLIRRTAQVKADLEFILLDRDPRFVRWYEKRGRGVFLQATPIEISEILAERLFDRVRTAILTSATLTSGGSFRFIRSRLGIREARELIVPSPFDYAEQAILYLPPQMPDPRSPDFLEAAVEEIVKLLRVTQGRAFVLCTAIQQMMEMYERVRHRVPFPCFVQGQGSKSGVLARFRTTPHSVLFATSSFWQGVDVQGEALSCVIIDRLPFAVPTDPIVAARQRYIEQTGGDPFYEYAVPQAVIMLKQGLGRLIRSRSDVGVLSILDPRIRTKSYGAVFLQSLPPCPITTRIEDVERFFDRHASR